MPQLQRRCGKLIFHTASPLTIQVGLFFLVLWALFTWLPYVDRSAPGSPSNWIMLGLAALYILAHHGSRAELSSEAITKRSFFGLSRRTLTWASVASYGKEDELELTDGNGDAIRFSRKTLLWPILDAQIRTHLAERSSLGLQPVPVSDAEMRRGKEATFPSLPIRIMRQPFELLLLSLFPLAAGFFGLSDSVRLWSHGHPGALMVLIASIVMIAVGHVMALSFLRSRVFITEEGISTTGFMQSPETLDWDEIEGLSRYFSRLPSNGQHEIYIIWSGLTYLQINRALEYEKLLAPLLASLPATARLVRY